MSNVFVRIIAMPGRVRAFTVVDPEGCYNVYVNAALASEDQHDALAHELDHISGGDFDGHTDIDNREFILHKK